MVTGAISPSSRHLHFKGGQMRIRLHGEWIAGVALALASMAGCSGKSVHGAGDMGTDLSGADFSGDDLTAAGDLALGAVADGMVRLSGSGAKGPLILASSVVVSPTDSSGNATGGQNYPTTTTGDDGRFSLTLPPVGLAQLHASGKFYMEIQG